MPPVDGGLGDTSEQACDAYSRAGGHESDHGIAVYCRAPMDDEAPSTHAPTTLWAVTPELIVTLDATLGAPVDSYLNGSQVWLTPDGPNDVVLEWRLHPVGGFRQPAGISHYDLWEIVVAACSVEATDPAAINFGEETRSLDSLWTGLESFAAYGDPMTPEVLTAVATAALTIAPDLAGVVNHRAIGDEWTRTGRTADLAALVRAALEGAKS